MLLALDLAGTFAFGLSGGLVGVRARLDLFGIIVLAAVVGLVGGITRDIILGSLPPATFNDWRYLAVARPPASSRSSPAPHWSGSPAR